MRIADYLQNGLDFFEYLLIIVNMAMIVVSASPDDGGTGVPPMQPTGKMPVLPNGPNEDHGRQDESVRWITFAEKISNKNAMCARCEY